MRDDDDFFKPFDGHDTDDEDRPGSRARGSRFRRDEPDEDLEQTDSYDDSPFSRTAPDDEFEDARTRGFDDDLYDEDDDEEFDDEEFDEEDEFVDDDEYVDYSHGVDTYDVGARRSKSNMLAIGAGLIVVVLLAGFALMKILGPKDNKAESPTTSTSQYFFAPSTIDDSTPTTAKGTTSTTQKIEASVNSAFDAWEAYAVNGNMTGLSEYFVRGGPQYNLFNRVRGNAQGIHYTITPSYLEVLSGGKNERVVLVDASITPEGGSSRKYKWEIIVRKNDGSWKIYSIAKRN